MRATVLFGLLLGFLAVSHALNCRSAPTLSRLRQIEAGQGVVVATDVYSRAYLLSGNSWSRLGTYSLSYVTAGPLGIWGIDGNGYTYKYVSENFKRISTTVRMRSVDAGGVSAIVGASRTYAGTCLYGSWAKAFYGAGNWAWRTVAGGLLHISCSPQGGCWAINTRLQVLFTQTLTASCAGIRWVVVPGQMRVIKAATDGSVFAVDRQGSVFRRVGISSRVPQGTTWYKVPYCSTVRTLTYDLRTLWLYTTSNTLVRCTI